MSAEPIPEGYTRRRPHKEEMALEEIHKRFEASMRQQGSA
jgi:hypothetical protein